jgi:hypothetical protein
LVALRKPNSLLKLLPKLLLPLLLKLLPLLLLSRLLLPKLLLPIRLLLLPIRLPLQLLLAKQNKFLNKDLIKKETEATLSLFFVLFWKSFPDVPIQGDLF